ncbi:hypothetical protein HMPREF9080_02949 [Cardiobacterium valvarum F0432]|uniref:Uncharacterized protein n=1 Tax=Cardiobacterium valvarum F0432 TaxID=797473 RepID=G9ZJI0_9GAMM|nr:hypothetical protein HMPREF9080_02949 [Cardiobacterium valvarum F0432]
MRTRHVHAVRRCSEAFAQEAAHGREGQLALFFAEGVVIEAGQDVALFDVAAEVVIEVVLRFVVHHPVVAGDKELQRRGDGLGIGDDAISGVVEAEQDAHRDGADDQRVAVEIVLPRLVVGEVMRLDVAVDEEVAAQLVEQAQAAARERNIKLDLERGRSEHGAAHRRGIVVQPGGDLHRADTLRDDGDIFQPDAVFALNVLHEILNIGDGAGDAGRIPTRAGAVTVPACVPGEISEVVETKLVGDEHQAAGMLVPPVEKDNGLVRAAVFGGAVAVKKGRAVAGSESFLLFVHGDSLLRGEKRRGL